MSPPFLAKFTLCYTKYQQDSILVIVAHGASNGDFFDNEGKRIAPSDFDNEGDDQKKGSSLTIIDLVSCNATDFRLNLSIPEGVDIRTYNPTNSKGESKTLRHYHTNTVLQSRIPYSIRNNDIENPLW
jgi:hypothetical protein